MLRFPDGMRARMKEEAAKNGRSLNAEIIARLQASLEQSDIHWRTGRPFPTAEQMQKAADAFMALLEHARDLGIVNEQADAERAISLLSEQAKK